MRIRARVDVNQSRIVKALREYGATVAITSQLGGGFPDIVVGYACRNFMFEIKDPKKPLSQRKLTPDEQRFSDAWEGQYAVVQTAEEAIAILAGE